MNYLIENFPCTIFPGTKGTINKDPARCKFDSVDDIRKLLQLDSAIIPIILFSILVITIVFCLFFFGQITGLKLCLICTLLASLIIYSAWRVKRENLINRLKQAALKELLCEKINKIRLYDKILCIVELVGSLNYLEKIIKKQTPLFHFLMCVGVLVFLFIFGETIRLSCEFFNPFFAYAFRNFIIFSNIVVILSIFCFLLGCVLMIINALKAQERFALLGKAKFQKITALLNFVLTFAEASTLRKFEKVVVQSLNQAGKQEIESYLNAKLSFEKSCFCIRLGLVGVCVSSSLYLLIVVLTVMLFAESFLRASLHDLHEYTLFDAAGNLQTCFSKIDFEALDSPEENNYLYKKTNISLADAMRRDKNDDIVKFQLDNYYWDDCFDTDEKMKLPLNKEIMNSFFIKSSAYIEYNVYEEVRNAYNLDEEVGDAFNYNYLKQLCCNSKYLGPGTIIDKGVVTKQALAGKDFEKFFPKKEQRPNLQENFGHPSNRRKEQENSPKIMFFTRPSTFCIDDRKHALMKAQTIVKDMEYGSIKMTKCKSLACLEFWPTHTLKMEGKFTGTLLIQESEEKIYVQRVEFTGTLIFNKRTRDLIPRPLFLLFILSMKKATFISSIFGGVFFGVNNMFLFIFIIRKTGELEKGLLSSSKQNQIADNAIEKFQRYAGVEE